MEEPGLESPLLNELDARFSDRPDAPASEGAPETSRRISSMAMLAASAIRDLGGPVTYLLANLEYLDSELARHEADLPEGRVNELRQCLREALVATARIRDVVREGSSGEPPRENGAHVDLHRVLLSCIKVARTETNHRARVITEFCNLPPVPGNESRLSRLFLNLLLNAAQAVAGDPEKEHFIRVVTRHEPGTAVTVEVTDSGPGISPEYIDRVFEPFFTTRPAGEGTGLGLAICKRIVGDMGGEITVDSTPLRGARLRVVLPVTRPERKREPGDRTLSPTQPPIRRLPVRQLG
jgi:signal transduction histidine kinase